MRTQLRAFSFHFCIVMAADMVAKRVEHSIAVAEIAAAIVERFIAVADTAAPIVERFI